MIVCSGQIKSLVTGFSRQPCMLLLWKVWPVYHKGKSSKFTKGQLWYLPARYRYYFMSKVWDLEGLCKGRKVRAQKVLQTIGVSGVFPQKMFKFRVPEIPFPAFSAGHLQYANMKESAVRLQGRHIFLCFIPLKHFLLNDKRIKDILTQKKKEKELSVILIKSHSVILIKSAFKK